MLIAILIVNILVVIFLLSGLRQVRYSISVIMVALHEMKGDVEDIKDQTDKLGTYDYHGDPTP